MKREDREVFDLTAGGKSTLVQELCIEGSDINTGYLKHLDCWERISNDTQYCNDMFEKSQHMLMQDDVIERLRVFHACCNFEWHKQCKYKAAETQCLDDAKEYIEQVSTLLGGRILRTLCGTQGTYSNCYNQLYGVEAEDLDERYSKYSDVSSGVGSRMRSVFVVLALFLVI
ncbi:hypothetical protein JTE90_025277 [Oedothorax gibbosus]|uniref:Uncharacterized protein n=1 Tax=Oedothorax gibbosus TaxID=931172 RepID=A0AAV6TKH9_9ARAC|nr:hypothetical protein JTE90_025277 [Oedothorax gibbosus]